VNLMHLHAYFAKSYKKMDLAKICFVLHKYKILFYICNGLRYINEYFYDFFVLMHLNTYIFKVNVK